MKIVLFGLGLSIVVALLMGDANRPRKAQIVCPPTNSLAILKLAECGTGILVAK